MGVYHLYMRITLHRSALNWILFFLLTFAVLWRGGKALDATWMLAGIACFITLADVFFVPKSERVSPPLALWSLACALVVWTVISFYLSSTKNYGLDEVMQTASLFLLFHFALGIPATDIPKFTSRFARILSIAALVACAVGIIVYSLQPVSRFVGTFFDVRFSTDYWPNAWAEFLLFAWPLMVWSLWGRKTKVEVPIGKILVMALLNACLLLSYSRGAIIVFVAQILFLAVAAFVAKAPSFSVRLLLQKLAAVLMVTFVFFILINHLRSQFNPVQSVLEKATFTASEGKSSVSERAQFFEQSFYFAAQKPLFGYGPYSFRFLQPHAQQSVLATSDHPHNVFLKLAMERGVIASILFLLIVTWCFLSALRRETRRNAKAGSLLMLLLLVSVLGVILHNLIDYNLQFVGISAPLWIALGLLPTRTERKIGTSLQTIITVLLAIALLLVTLSEGRYLTVSSLARKAERAGDYSTALSLYSRTTASMFPRDGWLSRAKILMTDGDLDSAQVAIDRAMVLNNLDYRIWKLQGDLFIARKDPSNALIAFGKAYDFGRYNDLGITRALVELLRTQPKTLDARRNEFELLLNDFGLAIEENTHFIDLSQNVEELAKLCSLLAAIYPEDAAAYRSLSDRSMEHALLERSRLSARPRGLLW